MPADWVRKTDILPLAAEGRRHAAGNGQESQDAAPWECSVEEDDRRVGFRHGDFEGSHDEKLVSPERRRRTITKVRRRLGPQKLSEHRKCRVLDQPRSTRQYQSRRVDTEPRLLCERALASPNYS